MDDGPARPRVLFVDDEQHMLAGLRRMLHTSRARLDLQFACSGPDALDLMARDPVDVIVSDMRMPGMDGARLLAEVQRRYPGCVRIVLSGEADRSSVLSAIGSAQQFLAKPCDADTLLGVLERALEVRRSLDDPTVRELIGGVVSLPTLPEVYDQLVTAIHAPDVQLQDVAAILAGDVATSADVLRLVNSAFFGLPQDVTSVQLAVALLGAENIRALVLTGAVFRVDGGLAGTLDARQLRDRALRRAALGRVMARAETLDGPMVDQIGLTCMLRDAGLLLLAQGMPVAARELADALGCDPLALDPVRVAELEAAHFGCTVPQASAYLLGLWSFAPGVVHALAGQPLTGSATGATLSEQILDFAHRRTLAPSRQVPAYGVRYLSGDRLDSWNELCDNLIHDSDEAAG